MTAQATSQAPAARALAALADAQGALPGGAAWAAFRAQALARLTRAGLPTPRDDGYKYANLRILERRDLRPAAADGAPHGTPGTVLPGALKVLLVDGRAGAPCPHATAGLSVEPLAAALGEASPDSVPWLATPGDDADDRLRLWGAACLNDGVVIRVARGCAVEPVLHVVHLARSGASYPRVRIELAEGATLTIVEEHVSTADTDTVTLGITDIAVGAGARLTHVRLQDSAARAVLLEDVRVEVAAGGAYAHHAHSFGASLNRLDLSVRLAGARAETDLYGLFMAAAGRGVHVRTRITHDAPDTRSAQTYRGVAGARGRGSYDGKVVVAHGAARANSRQSSRNLLLAKDAEIDTRPQLEIYTDDVQCSHGATTGTLDEQMLFYLLSRGLDPATARGLLTYAFAADVVREVPVADLKAQLRRRVVGLLPDASRLEEFLT